ncbi:uncharacterized protein LOC130627535 isoform X2 [Hydractinia symbiolongicarpus]|uniref:uncharacterized protein LOC130627535 isoform X2 n=1 Tax=Hydractinia symbiolongicarpus TaxID=13093 RepID=UPI00254AFF4A|nr:uncharacterized protein LOC130627535 isoform X2 [Hydractinia symbiolongicarpus]
MSNESGINDSSNTVRGFRLFNNLGRFVLQQRDNNQGLVGAILRQQSHISQNFEFPQEIQRNVVPRLSDNEDVALARRRQHAQCVASLRRLESTDQANTRRHNDTVRQTARRNAESAQQVINRRHVHVQRHAALRVRRSAQYYNVARQHVLPNVYYLGPMDKNCEYCQAVKFENEECFKCCHNGKVALDNLSPYPERLKQLLTNSDTGQARNFQANIRGRALNERMARPENNGCREDVMQTVQDVMNSVSPFAAAYRYMAEVEADEIAQAAAENRVPSEVRMCMRVGSDRRRYNLPHHDEAAAIFVGQDGAPPGNRDIITYPRGGNLQNISTLSANLEPMVYPLFFPRGEPGWYYGIPHVAERATCTRNTTTMLQYYTYRVAVRENFSPIHYDPNDKLRDADDIDSVISAEIPNQQEQPELFEIIRSCMIHGPCGYLNPNSRCMEDGVCTKNFPKKFLVSTVADVDGYPLYRRRNNGIHINVNNVDVDNRWVVPYNPWLSKKYNAHINLEACMSVKSVKYLYKYIYKGHDCANIEINERIDHNEVQTFLDARYVSAPEAVWRLFEFKMHQQSHVVHRLPVHLPNNYTVYFQPDQVEEFVNRAENQATKLTAWFVLNGENHNARQYLYPDIPLHFVFNNNRKVWTPRRN